MIQRDFRLGFIVAPRRHRFKEQTFLHRWNRILFHGYKIFVHPEATMSRVDNAEGVTVLVIGDIFVAHGSAQLDELLLRTATGDREALDDLSGRFALFIFDGEEGCVMHDPLGSQAIFRTLGPGPVVSSHATLIAECDSLPPSSRVKKYMASEEYRSKVTRFLPGDLTMYEQIVHLIPNNELDLVTGSTSRYWPRTSIKASTFDDVARVWDEYFTAYAKYIQARYNPVIGLTGGLDSRAVIAVLRDKAVQANYITWDKMPAAEAARIPGLVEHLGSSHSWVRMQERPATDRSKVIREAARTAAGLTRGIPLLPAQVDEVTGPRSLFIKGLGGEVMRGPFNSRQKSHLPMDLDGLAYALYAGEIRKTAGVDYEQFTRRAIQGYLKRANYHVELCGVDYGDLLYWEQRMGTWTAVQHAEFSVVLNSHSAMNSRRIFAASWGLEDRNRFGPELLDRLIRQYDTRIADL
ncbi:hypothetical protein ACTXKH_16305 [Brachybacterium tyrofermentans]|uniref:hypothetical protein n=1 Tax=Brachybacterium tyrofermentans TaxID=47848 RepID=UPI003FCF7E84